MRYRTPKRAKIERAMKPERDKYLARAVGCECCHHVRATEVHEIARGIHRLKAIQDRCTWLAVCNVCNCYDLTDYSRYPLEHQLALKWIADFDYFDLERFNKLRDRAPGAITMAEVCVFICRELDG